MKSTTNILFASLIMVFFQASWASDLQNIPNAGQIEKRFKKPAKPVSEPEVFQKITLEGAKPPENAKRIRFTLEKLEIESMTAMSREEVLPVFSQFIHKEITLNQLYEIADKLTALYANSGYILSRVIVPPQRIEKGVVRLKVIEGYIDSVVINGLDEPRQDFFDKIAQKITNSRPLHNDDLERYLLLLNDLPGFHFKSVLKASEKNPGASNLILNPSFKPWDMTVMIDNYGSETSGPYQTLLQGKVHNVFGQLDTASLTVATVPNDPQELHYFSFEHQSLLNSEGLRLLLNATYTQSEPDGDFYKTTEVETDSSIFGIGLSYPLIRSRQSNWILKGDLSSRQSKTEQFSETQAEDRLRKLRLATVYDQADNFLKGGVSQFQVSVIKGLDIGDAKVESRLAEKDFQYYQIGLRRIQKLSNVWGLDVHLQLQKSNESLPASELFGIGGERKTRGYEPAEWIADSGYAMALELNYQMSRVPWKGNVQFYGFYDFAKAELEEPLPAEEKNIEINSFGLGTRLGLSKHLNFNFEMAKPIDRHADGDKAEWQLYGRLSLNY